LVVKTGGVGEKPSIGGGRRALAWAGLGVAAAGAGLGVFGTIAWIDRQREFDQNIGPLPEDLNTKGLNCGSDDPDFGGPGCAGIHSRVVWAQVMTIGGYGLAALSAAASIYLFATAPDARPKPDTALRCAPDPSGKGLSCFMTF
jgi:hypothetical protein